MKRFFLHIICSMMLLVALLSLPAFAAGKGVVLNFNEVDISTMVKFISDLTGRNFILDDRVKGKISVYSPAQLSIDEAYNVFVSVLELKGFTVVQSGRVAKIIPIASAKQAGVTILQPGDKLPVNESYVAQVIKLGNITAQEALGFLQPMVSKDGHISIFGPGNLLLIVDSSLNVRKLHGILRLIDTEKTREGFEIIYLKNAAADGVATIIKQWLSGGEVKSPVQQIPGLAPQSTPSSGSSISIMSDQRLNAILVFGNDSIKKTVRDMAEKLDIATPDASNKVNVYYLENTDATEMSKVLDGVIRGMSANANASATQAMMAAQASAFDSGKITITPDKASNALVIMASPSDYNNLIQVIKKLDRRSKQVFVQVLIAEVSLNKSRAIGMQLGALGVDGISRYFGVGGFYDPFGVISSLATLGISGNISGSSANASIKFPVGGVPANIGAVLQALDSKDLLNVLSTPNILTSDNKEAEITVGENVPLQGSSTLSTTGVTTSVDRKDIGISLKIKPQISEGDYIRMDISQEISAVKNNKGQAIDLVTTKRAAKTSIVVKDNETVVIGGLIQDQEEEIINKVPFLGDIPLLGWFFKTKNKVHNKTNLMILLTPRIVKDANDLNQISNELRIKFGDSANKIEPVDVQKEITGYEQPVAD